MWYLTRSTGIVATVLAALALAWGFLFSARATGNRLRPAWWLDLHNWLGGLSLVFIGVHIVTSWLDHDTRIGLLQIFVPGTAKSNTAAIGWGVVGTYLFALAVFTTWPRRLANRRWWRIVHLGSVIAMAMALIHALQMGSDASTVPFRVGFVAVATFAVYTLGLRLFGWLERAKRSPAQRGAGREPATDLTES